MDAKKISLHDFISEKRTFVIPVYQRNYGWHKENCERLFNDIEKIILNGKSHFIGTFVFMEDSCADIFRELVIIDGQQRITSIILFAKALYDSTDNADLKEDIRSTFIKHSRGELKNKCKLRPTEYDSAVFEKLMGDDAFDENNFNPDEKSSAMYQNLSLFRKKIAASNYKPKDFFNATGKLNVVCIRLDEENPQEIFESLNSTGLDLSKADLIRNFLLMPLDYVRQEELYKKYWLEIENLLRPSDNVENFVMQYLIVKRKSDSVMESKKQRLSKKNLYEVFKGCKEEFYPNNNVEDFLKDLYHYAKFFRRFIFNADTKFENLSALDKKFYELVYSLEANNAPIILMYLLDRYEKNSFDEETFIKFIDALISLTFRAKVCGNTGITTQFAGNVLARLDTKNLLDEKFFWQVITFGKGTFSFPKNEQFQASLVGKNLYQTIKSGGCKYLLYSLECVARSKELPAYSEATIEHILPQKLNESWKKYLTARNDSSAHEIWLHTLGNLSLTSYNSELANKDFDAKKEIYSQSHFFYTRALIKYPEWTSKQIQTRAKKLAEIALKIWTLPEEFNSRFANVGDIFNLDSDFNYLIGTKPESVFISESEIKISNWADFLREVVKHFYNFDKDIFQRAVQMENVPRRNSLFSTTAKNFRYEFKVDENYYMQSGWETVKCLGIIKAVTENFDRLAGTTFRDDIYFTLRRRN